MNIIESYIERLAWILVLVVFVGEVIGLIILSNILHNLKQQQTYFHNSNNTSLSIIKQNQATQTTAIKDYIACLLAINPQNNLTAQEQVCFNKVPEVK